jgi:flagellar basal-body rod protein FlgG
MPVSYVLQTLTSGMIQNQKHHDSISNNLANVNTNGFKRDVAVVQSFSNVLKEAQNMPRIQKDLYDEIYHTDAHFDHSNIMHEIKTHYGQGDMRLTENPLDVALTGEGYFTIQTEEGIRYTRNGEFMLNQANQLVTSEGYHVLGIGGDTGEGAPITVQGKNISFLDDGTVQADGISVGTLKIAEFADKNVLVKTGHGLFNYEGSQEDVRTVSDPRLESGYLESSNVNAITEMTEMLQNMRHYEIAGRSMKEIETTLNRLITDVPKLK